MVFRSSKEHAVRFVLPVVRSCMPIIFLLWAARIGMTQMPGQNLPGLPSISAEQSEHGIRATMGSEVLDIVVCSDSVIHVVARANADVEQGPKPWMLDASQSCPGAPFQFAQGAKADTLKTKQLEVNFSLDRETSHSALLVARVCCARGTACLAPTSRCR